MLEALLDSLDYRPSDSAIILRSITHRSFSADHNERLEFLGDAVIDLVIAELLFIRFPSKPEGELSRYRSELVRSESLAQLAKEIGLNQVIKLGEGERKSGGAERESILSGALEAFMGAIYLDGGLEPCKRITSQLFAERIEAIENLAQQKDPKTALQELLQAHNRALPRYNLVNASGQHHHQLFRIACHVDAFNKSVEAEGNSKKQAERKAAELMLAWIHQEKKL